MKFLSILIAGLTLFAASPVLAQGGDRSADPSLLLNPPIIEPANPDGSRCFNIFNNAPYSVTGSVVTNLYETADGTSARQRANFRLKSKESQRLCSYGPFYPGERLELVLRTLVPIFSCYTVAQGDIVIMGETRPEGSKTWAVCQ